MSRLARRIIPGYVYHLTHRGNNKQRLFYREEDYRKYLYWFEEARMKYEMEVLAYCLMPNHVHFVGIAQKEESFAKVINSVHTKFALYFNSKHGNVGHVWQGRYFSCLLEDSHLLAAMRYVERNPSRAKLSNQPWDWKWSSAACHVSSQRGIVSLKVAMLEDNRESWKEFIELDDKEEDLCNIRQETNARRAWGSEDFINKIDQDFSVDLRKKRVGRPKLVTVPNLMVGE